MKGTSWKIWVYASFIGLLLYAIGMIVIRLQMTQTAYRFEEVKSLERSLREEQMRLKAAIAKSLNEHERWLSDFHDPRPDQIVVMPLSKGSP